jgi:RNA ligase (TIGR02306 family)
MNEIVRKLASVRRVSEETDISEADNIKSVKVDGWWVVVKKEAVQVGDLVVYFEIDSWVPHRLAPFLSKGKDPKTYNGLAGARLKTIRLKGQLSQGLILTLDECGVTSTQEGEDLTELLGVIKWEPPAPKTVGARGNFPSFLRKTDQERIQNIPNILEENKNELYEVSLKLDGSSITVYCNNGDVGVCSRNLDLKLEGDEVSHFVASAKATKWLDVVENFYNVTGRSIALQGELMGPGIQGNREKFIQYRIFLFDIWDIDLQRYWTPYERKGALLTGMFGNNIEHVPWILGFQIPQDITMDAMLVLPTTLGATTFKSYKQPIEGLVFKPFKQEAQSFKVINNEFLLGDK